MEILKLEPGIADIREKEAEELKDQLADSHVLYLSLLSSPGAGKTRVLQGLLKQLDPDFRSGIVEADVDSAIDAKALEESGYRTIQVYTDDPSYIDAVMSRQALNRLGLEDLDLVFLEGAGTPVGSKDVDSGAHGDILVFSVPEGDDKPQKYPLLFKNADLILINKIDVLEFFNFDLEKFKASVRMLNPNVPIIEVSAKTGFGLDAAADWIRHKYRALEL